MRVNFERLTQRVADDSLSYQAALPFPSIVIDDFLTPPALAAAQSDFPRPEAITDWRRLETKDAHGHVVTINKLGYSNELAFGSTLRGLVHELNASPFLRYLEKLTGAENLIPDPHMTGGGLHQYLPGAILGIHADFNRLPGADLDRRLNLIIYLNGGWQREWKGDLELWDVEMSECVQSIAPVENRCVIFSTTSTSYHGMPGPLACPPGITRRSLALYYYSNGRPVAEQNPTHSTLWQNRPNQT
ncbi:MAG: 2OG-Fe(II) oxygenase [Acidobacteriales bacterium]|nr:2OG-Fe(II) oxygenase [Terriglobales bacterium]